MNLYRCYLETSTGLKKGMEDHDRYFISCESGVIFRIHGKNDVEVHHISNLGTDGLSKLHIFCDRKIFKLEDLLINEPVKMQEVKIVESANVRKHGRPKLYP